MQNLMRLFVAAIVTIQSFQPFIEAIDQPTAAASIPSTTTKTAIPTTASHEHHHSHSFSDFAHNVGDAINHLGEDVEGKRNELFYF